MALDMTTALTIRAKVDGLKQVQGLGKALGNTEKQANGLAGAFGRLKGAGSSIGAIFGAAGISALLKRSVDTFSDFQAETKLLENGLRNVGAGTGELERLQKVASDLGEATLFNENDFRKGFGLLTSFGNIGTSNYERVAKAAADVAQTSGTDVSSAFMQLAKALNDPAKGLTALGRSGIQFTEDQKAVIESLAESGNVAQAQNLILKELEKQYGNNSVAAAQGLAGALDTLGEKFYDLQVALGDNVAQVLQPLIQGLTSLVGFISGLPEPVQTFIAALGGLTVALTALGGVIAIGAPIFSALAGLGPILAGIPALIASLASAIGPLVAGLGTLGQILIGVFTGPVGWIALIAGAGVAIYAFRDQIGDALQSIGQFFIDAFAAIGELLKEGAKAYLDFFVKPVLDFAKTAVDGILKLFNKLPEAIKAPFIAVGNAIKGAFRAVLSFLVGLLNTWIGRVNSAINLANRLPGVNVPQVPTASVPAFAQGGVVNGPTLAMVGEGGQREYIVPESKMARASANYLSGMRGRSVIPAFAEGGVVNGGMAGNGAGNTSIQITTGPVMQQDGTQYVTLGDLERALRDFGSAVFGNARTPGGRRYQGVRA